MYFNHKFIENKYISHKKKRKSLNKIFVSKAEIKHTNSKAIITIYVYNREKLILLKKITRLKKIFVKLMIKSKILKLLSFPYPSLANPHPFRDTDKGIVQDTKINRNLSLGYAALNKLGAESNTNVLSSLLNYNIKGDLNKTYKELYYLSIKISKTLAIIRRYRLRLSLNKYKFEDKFLYKLTQYISKYYGKKVEFNIVNIKSIAYNGDIFTEILTSKIKKEKTSPI
jgi:hypothetical protein